MTSLVALSVSIGVLGAIATWLALGPLAAFLIIWVIFIGWATFFATGGDQEALKKTITCNVFGVVCAWIAALIILGIPLGDAIGLPLWGAIVVGATVLGMCLAAHIKALSTIPASVYGYAATFAFLLQTPDVLSMSALTSVSFSNALIVVAISLAVGAIFGLLSGKLGDALTKKSQPSPAV